MGVHEGLEDVIECLDTGSIAIERRTNASFDTDGNAVRGTIEIRNISPAVVHIATGRDLLRLPEGDRTSEVLLIFTQQRLRTARVASGQEADVVLYQSQPDETSRYVIRTSEDWIRQSGHYRSLAVKREGS
jgi:hypothetical protein